jgi:hypothetical protein
LIRVGDHHAADGFLIGEPLSVVRVDYDGNEHIGLTTRCRREDGFHHVVAALEVMFPKVRAANVTELASASGSVSILALPEVPYLRAANGGTKKRCD